MSRFYNPYQFVPVTGEVNGKKRVGHADYAQIATGTAATAHPGVRHDLWHPRCVSGRILCSLYLNSPLVVGAGQTRHPQSGSNEVEQYTWRGVEAIPANSLKGMVSSVAEALSQSAMRVLSDNLISLRITDDKSSIGTTRVTHHLKAADYFRHIDNELVPWRKDRESLSPAELLFGAVEVNEKGENPDHGRNLAGRLRFHDALPVSRPVTRLATTTLRILDSPKFYFSGDSKGCCVPFYLHLEGQRGGFLTTDDIYHKHTNRQIWPNGRKRYLHHPDSQVQAGHWRSDEPSKRANLKLRCAPIAAGQTFRFHVDFENLSAAELTLLEYALAPGVRFQHRLGLGKPLGLGSLTLCIEGVYLIDRLARYSAESLAAPANRYDRVWRPTHTPSVEAREQDFAATHPREWDALNGAPPLTKPADLEDTSLIDQGTLDVLLTIGDPRYLEPNVTVHTPLTEDQVHTRSEDRTFEWFKENKERGRQALPPVQAQQLLPGLFSTSQEARASGNTFSPTVAYVKPAEFAAVSGAGQAAQRSLAVQAWLSEALEGVDSTDSAAVCAQLKNKTAAEAWERLAEEDRGEVLTWWMAEVRKLDAEMPMFNLLSKGAMRVLKRVGVDVSGY